MGCVAAFLGGAQRGSLSKEMIFEQHVNGVKEEAARPSEGRILQPLRAAGLGAPR